MRKEREITIKFIENKRINNQSLVNFFAKKYNEKNIEKQNKKS